MHNVCTFEACKSVRQAAESKGDEGMLHALISVNHDLIAAEANYHKTCFASYVSKSNLKHKSFKEKEAETAYDAAFKEMSAFKEISKGIYQGKAYDMSSLLSKYRECLEDKGIKVESYSKQRLKLRLVNHFRESIVFHHHPDKRKPEVIYSSNISLQDVLNAAAAQNARTRSENNISDNAQQIVNIARQVKEEIRNAVASH